MSSIISLPVLGSFIVSPNFLFHLATSLGRGARESLSFKRPLPFL